MDAGVDFLAQDGFSAFDGETRNLLAQRFAGLDGSLLGFGVGGGNDLVRFNRGLALGFFDDLQAQAFSVSQTLGAGHVLTLAHYLSLLNHAGLLVGLHKYSHQTIRQRQSPPKFQVLNNALFSAQGTHGFAEALADRSRWGRLVESTIGTHLLNSADQDTKIHYWRDSSLEVDFVIEHRGRLAAIEVKSAGVTGRLHGLDEFCKRHPEARRFVVGGDALPIGEFLMQPATAWVA